ncbi:hypothetical protein [Embleya sp. NPDC020630]|uniref:hypothetical protein n=1 Tax=Embleya sp. NPDC020630 TaxID=3363979 RepID=UPI00378C073B
MHDSTPSLADAQARWDAAHAAVVAHAAKGRRNDAVPPEDPDALAAWDAEHAAWVEAWDRVQAESRAAAVALAQVRHAQAE